ncbi:GNAT family N-acetyltransferase [Thiomicrorhabdus sediminis]|uniref:GNAT family N-acetyltransferase n=1 Tax=Thiomicrorhabdus sediminis TaxID=2580412 RepID=A0A4P9K6K4_9GAMM|nr:GNAT family N-acetyltransferase [Thiomicrorhabdus sediminis]QCU90685.1 GNAT family N-acetyltransferase [Thiomicrorhabdus sediminis]
MSQSKSPENRLSATHSFALAEPDEFYQIRHFLKRHKTHGANRDDWIFTVKLIHSDNNASENKPLIGIARLLPVEDSITTLWLRGLFIAPEHRNQGIATALLEFIHQQLVEDKHFESITNIAAFSETHLQLFYQQNHYQQLLAEQIEKELPPSLWQKFDNASRNNKSWLCWQLTI